MRDRRSARPRAVLLLAAGFGAALVGSHWRALRGWVIADRDAARIFFPDSAFLERCLGAGELPLWQPHAFLGSAFAGSLQAQVFYPPRVLAVLAAGPYWGVTLLQAAHVGIAAVGAFLLARALGRSVEAAALCAAAFGFSPVLADLGTTPNLVHAAAWAPWVLFAASRGSVAGVAGTLGLSLLAGSPEMTLWTLGLLGVAAARRRTWARLLGAVAWAGGLAAAALLPAAEAALASARGTGRVDPLDWSASPSQLLAMGWPLADAPRGPYWGEDQWLLIQLFAGTAVVALAVVGARRSRRALPYAIGAVVFAVLALGRHFPPSAGLLSAPPLNAFRYPAKYLVGALFCLVVLAAYGVDALAAARRWRRKATRGTSQSGSAAPHEARSQADPRFDAPGARGAETGDAAPSERRARADPRSGAPGARGAETGDAAPSERRARADPRSGVPGARGAGPGGTAPGEARSQANAQSGALGAVRPGRVASFWKTAGPAARFCVLLAAAALVLVLGATLLPAGLRAGFPWVLVALGATAAAALLPSTGRGARRALLGLALAELAIFHALQVGHGWAPASEVARPASFAAQLDRSYRISVPPARRADEAGALVELSREPSEALLLSRQVFVPNRFAEDDVRALEGYGAPEPARIFDFQLSGLRAVADLAGVRHFLREGAPPFPDLRAVAALPGGVTAYQSETAFPRAWVVSRARAATDREVLSALARGSAPFREEALLAKEGPPLDAPPCLAASARVVSESCRGLELEATACEGGGVLVIGDAHAPGWRAEVDGAAVEVLRADLALRAVRLPPGTHRVRMTYSPRAQWIGLLVSAAALALLLLELARGGRARLLSHD